MTNPYRDALVELVAAYDAPYPVGVFESGDVARAAQKAWLRRQNIALEAARRAAALPVDPVRMLTEEEADYCECNTYANTADAIQRKFMAVNAGKTIPALSASAEADTKETDRG